ncbi:MAG: tRNA dihydrouridine synthase DusB [Candidatus Omnitrophica bacterium]|nr:tRNA dihydrouridine synthase DusB [Candidatus Omnitrophota bacterium]
MLKIGDLKLKSRLILAPMAGISDLPFRLLCRKFGAELAFVEMINARSIGHKSRRTRSMLSTSTKDKPLGIQLLGSEEPYIRKALQVLKEYRFDILDFNAACPAKKVVRRGEGASLMKDPKKLSKLLKLVVKGTKAPVTVKIRSGWDKDSVNAREVALYAEDAGVAGVFVHGRTKVQGYGGSVDYKSIKEVKKALKVPVIASGDIFSAALINKMFDETGADAVAVARGALGNPWIFQDRKPDKKEVIQIMTEHLNSCVDFYGEKRGVIIWRKFFGWYTKGFRKVRPLREKSSRAKTSDEMLDIIREAA